MLTHEELAAMRKQAKTVEREDGETEYFVYVSRPKMLELLDEVERLRTALDRISRPIVYMQAEASILRAQLDGVMANQLANDPEFLKGIAKMALEGGNTNG